MTPLGSGEWHVTPTQSQHCKKHTGQERDITPMSGLSSIELHLHTPDVIGCHLSFAKPETPMESTVPPVEAVDPPQSPQQCSNGTLTRTTRILHVTLGFGTLLTNLIWDAIGGTIFLFQWLAFLWMLIGAMLVSAQCTIDHRIYPVHIPKIRLTIFSREFSSLPLGFL